jgi:NAD(P)-dependent dehydrogenase (short-subunit alcohol dehydrogenase family)
MLLDRQVAIVTGGGRGLGRAMALALAHAGARVVAVDLIADNLAAVERDAAAVTGGSPLVGVAADIRDAQDCRRAIDTARERCGGLDILVNNAGFQMTRSSILEIPEHEIDRVFRTNVYAMFYLCQAAIPQMPPGASIINTSSIQAYMPKPHLLHYAASKAAISNFTKGLSQELAERGIRVNAVAPGPVWTPLIPASHMDTEAFGQNAPLKRAAQPAEMAPIYVLLASTESSYVTGMVYGATGGQLMP